MVDLTHVAADELAKRMAEHFTIVENKEYRIPYTEDELNIMQDRHFNLESDLKEEEEVLEKIKEEAKQY